MKVGAELDGRGREVRGGEDDPTQPLAAGAQAMKERRRKEKAGFNVKAEEWKQGRTRKQMKEVQPTVEGSIPQPSPNNSLPHLTLRYLSFAAILVMWLWLTTLEAKLRAVMVAITFSMIEFHFRAITRRNPAEDHGGGEEVAVEAKKEEMSAAERDMMRAMGAPPLSSSPSVAPVQTRQPDAGWRRTMRIIRTRATVSHVLAHGHTTWEQFWANVFWGPIMNDFYHDMLFALLVPSFAAWHPLAQAGLRALFYPINIWFAEVVMGYYLTYFWRRRAWFYRGRWARLDGNITLAYGPLWNLLGGLYQVGYPLFYRPVPALIASLVR